MPTERLPGRPSSHPSAAVSPALVLALLSVSSAPARAVDYWVNPATMGPNAMPVYPGESPWPESRTVLRLGAAYQLTHRGDHSAVPSFRLEAPFGKWVTLVSEGIPMEWWSVTEETARAWDLMQRSGVSKGDLRFGVKILAVDGGSRFPSLAIRQNTKTTTGKNYYNRRFTNAPAYQLDGIFGHRFEFADAGRLELWATIGFLAWQQGANGQNDALTWGGTVAYRWKNEGHVRVELRGFTGWQEGSTPRVVAVGGEWPFTDHVGVYATANVGLVDAPLMDAHLGIVLRLPAVIPINLQEVVPSSPQGDGSGGA